MSRRMGWLAVTSFWLHDARRGCRGNAVPNGVLREPERSASRSTQLDSNRFFRLHRSTIVNIDRVREIHPMFRGDCAVVLRDGTRLKLSRTRRDEFESLFAQPRHRR